MINFGTGYNFGNVRVMLVFTKLPPNEYLDTPRYLYCTEHYSIPSKWISISVTLGLHRNYIYKEVSQKTATFRWALQTSFTSAAGRLKLL